MNNTIKKPKNSMVSIDSMGEESRAFRVRQERHVPANSTRHELKIGDKIFNVLNYSTFGIAILHQSVFDLTALNEESSLLVDGKSVSTFKLRFIRTNETDGGEFYSAFEVLDGTIPVDLVNAYSDLTQIMKSVSEKHESEKLIPEKVRAIVLESRNFFVSFKGYLDNFMSEFSLESTSIKYKFESSILDFLSPFLREKVDYFSKAIITAARSSSNQEQETRAFEYFRQVHRDIIYDSPFMMRSLQKPLGYAGDFEMMNLLYRSEDGGATLFHKMLERIFIKNEEAQAVRNRVGYLLNKIKQTIEQSDNDVHILSVASGPALEVQKAIEVFDPEMLSKCHFYLLDQDVVALKHAQKQALELSRGLRKTLNIHLIPTKIRGLLSNNLFSDKRFDLVYSAGLFDYFADDVARLVANSLLNVLKPNSSLVIGNFNSDSPGALPLSLFLDWNLIYRSKNDLQRLFGDLGKDFTVETEPMAVNLFANIKN